MRTRFRGGRIDLSTRRHRLYRCLGIVPIAVVIAALTRALQAVDEAVDLTAKGRWREFSCRIGIGEAGSYFR